MNGMDQAASTIWYILAMVLVGSALLSRRLPMGAMLRMALIWVAIFILLLGLFTLAERSGFFRNQFGSDNGTAMEQGGPAHVPPARSEGQSLHIPVAPDGHYWVEGSLNGTKARFLIDSGATFTALSEETARAAGLNFTLGEPGVIMSTANGDVEARRSSVATLAIGPIQTSDLDVVVSPAFGEVNVIGMNLLSRLDSWGVRNGQMVLTP